MVGRILRRPWDSLFTCVYALCNSSPLNVSGPDQTRWALFKEDLKIREIENVAGVALLALKVQPLWVLQLQGNEICQQPRMLARVPFLWHLSPGQRLGFSLVRPWLEHPVELCPDSWPTELWEHLQIWCYCKPPNCGNKLCNNNKLIQYICIFNKYF